MAGVKTQKGGKSIPPVFAPRHCPKCEKVIERHADGTVLRTFTFNGPKKSTAYSWVHKKCLDTK